MGEHGEEGRRAAFRLVKDHVGRAGRGRDLLTCAPYRHLAANVQGRGHCTLQRNNIYVQLSSNYFSYGYDIKRADYIW